VRFCVLIVLFVSSPTVVSFIVVVPVGMAHTSLGWATPLLFGPVAKVP
jgi:hypothetical protein